MKPEIIWIGRLVCATAVCVLTFSDTVKPLAADTLSQTNMLLVEDNFLQVEQADGVSLEPKEQVSLVTEAPKSMPAVSDSEVAFDTSECISLLYSLLLSRQLNPEFETIDTVEDFLHLLQGTCSLSEDDPELHHELQYSALVAKTPETLLGDLTYFSDTRGIHRIAVSLPDKGRIVQTPELPQLARSPKLIALCFFAANSDLQRQFCDVYRNSPFPDVEHRNIALTDFTPARINAAVRTALTSMNIADGDAIVLSAHGYLLPEAGSLPYPAGFRARDTITIHGPIVTEADVREAMAQGRAMHTARILDAIKSALDRRQISAHTIVDSCYSGRLLRAVRDSSFSLGRIRVLLTTSSEYSCATPAGFTNALSLALRTHQRQQEHDNRVTYREFLDLFLGHTGSSRPLGANDVLAAVGPGLDNTLMRLQQ